MGSNPVDDLGITHEGLSVDPMGSRRFTGAQILGEITMFKYKALFCGATNMDILVLRKAFGSRPFTATEAGWALGLQRPSGTLSRLKSGGLIEAVARGKYRVAEGTLKGAIEETLRATRLQTVLDGPAAVALDGPDAVAVWTEGRYVGGRVPGRDVVHLVCATKDRELLLGALDELEIRWSEGDDWPKGRGLGARLRFEDRLVRVRRGGLPVVSRAEVLRLIRADPATFEGASELVIR